MSVGQWLLYKLFTPACFVISIFGAIFMLPIIFAWTMVLLMTTMLGFTYKLKGVSRD